VKVVGVRDEWLTGTHTQLKHADSDRRLLLIFFPQFPLYSDWNRDGGISLTGLQTRCICVHLMYHGMGTDELVKRGQREKEQQVREPGGGRAGRG
jgi:hypothetical protein